MVLIIKTLLLLIPFILLMPLMASLACPTSTLIKMTKSALKKSLFISLILLFLFIDNEGQTIIATMSWSVTTSFDITPSLKLDLYSIIFISVALFVTQSIMEYAYWYMFNDPFISKFFKYLLIFLMAMMILVTANNLLQLLIGWEGVGLMSFLLIGWWWGRAKAHSSALQAIIYNRTGDIGLILSMAWLSTTLNTWELQQMLIINNPTPILPLLGFILTATGKSAQFGLHLWLPSAMEAPTPVSALLHSSTMVVAGIFLLIRIHPLLATNKTALSICLCLGAITTLLAATCALTQNDIKKIIAFSTSSQLGLMMVTIGLNQPQLAFLHICMHAFFKAMLFLSAGSILHNLDNEQDIRKMGGLYKCLPITSSYFTIGHMALMGMPFLTGFYSKDAIIEAATTSSLNAWALLLTLTATSFTAVYSLRTILHVMTGKPCFHTMYAMRETNLMVTPLTRLAKGSIMTGLLISLLMMPETPKMTMPPHMKILALLMTTLSILFALLLIQTTNKLPLKRYPHRMYLPNMTRYDRIMAHRYMSKNLLKINQEITTHLKDRAWYEHTGPKGLTKAQIPFSTKMSSMQKGFIKVYMTSFMMTIMLLLLMNHYYL